MNECLSSPNRAGRIFGFGSSAVDFRIQTAEMGRDFTEKLVAQQCEVFGGGAISNCLVQIARLGGSAVWLGKLGTDWIGRRITDDLSGEGVVCQWVLRDPAVCSPFNVAVYAGPARRRVGGFLLPNSLASVTTEELAGWAEHFRAGDWLLAEIGEVPLASVESLCRMARKRQVKIAVDVDLDPRRQLQADASQTHAVLALADLLVPNVAALSTVYPGLTPAELAARLAKDYGTTSVVTAGAEGAYFCCTTGDVRHQPPVATEVVDTVGAGDAFHGGLLYACAEGQPIEKAVELAARCGAEACRRFGARSAMATAAQLGLVNRTTENSQGGRAASQ